MTVATKQLMAAAEAHAQAWNDVAVAMLVLAQAWKDLMVAMGVDPDTLPGPEAREVKS